MSVVLFRKVNKKRGLELKNVLPDMISLCEEIEDYIDDDFDLIEKILKRINRDIQGGSFSYYNVEKAKVEIIGIFFRIEEYLEYLSDDAYKDDFDDYEKYVTDRLLRVCFVIHTRVDAIINDIYADWNYIGNELISQEKLYNDLLYVISLLRESKTSVLKKIKNLASLYAQGN